MIKIVLDMMGGDNGSAPTIEAVKEFIKEHDDVEIVAVGEENDMKLLEGTPRVSFVYSKSVVPMECSVMQAMRAKDSSVYLAVNKVNELKADGIVSAGSTGAFLSLVTLINKKLEGVDRPALITPFPTKVPGKYVVLLDVGASTENSSDDLVQFATMGQAYAKVVFNNPEPNVYLISNGTEEGKGSPLYKETYQKLKEKNPSFKGYVEGRNVYDGERDVVVFDGFTGNIFLKTAEGMAKMMSGMIKEAFMSSGSAKIGYLFAKKGFARIKKTMDYKKVGGALLVGVNTIAVKAHGNSDAGAYKASIEIVYQLAKNKVIEKIKENL